MNVLLLGGGAREHAIGAALCRSAATRLFVVSANVNPGLKALAVDLARLGERDGAAVVEWARGRGVELAVVGPEDPLEAGVPEALEAAGIPTVGPSRDAARPETSKLYTRELMRRYGIAGRVEYEHFADPDALERFLRSTDREFALKPVGLTGGKGVQVMGVQLDGVEAAVAYGRSVIEQRIGGDAGIVVEERLIGEEFTLQAFVDGETIVPMPLVQDFKRAYEGDRGPNTGSMGSYSQPDGLLPFLGADGRDEALRVMREIVAALRSERIVYRGIMYGQFMLTARGIRLVEINARFGDPEAINVLALLQTDLVDICTAITRGRLGEIAVEFAHEATVCKYVTPPGYPEQPRSGVAIEIDERAIADLGVQIFFARVDGDGRSVRTTTSRAVALVARAPSIAEAEAAVERALEHIHGEFHVRHDIGRPELIYRSAPVGAAPDRRTHSTR
jgi:phosphoribosylamine--glycine ligase